MQEGYPGPQTDVKPKDAVMIETMNNVNSGNAQTAAGSSNQEGPSQAGSPQATSGAQGAAATQ